MEELVRRGVKEVMLLGQDVNSYGRTVEGERSFPELLERINDIPEIRRIRFSTSDPQDLSPELLDAFVPLENLCEHLHLPLQSGSDAVLTRMRRGYRLEYETRAGAGALGGRGKRPARRHRDSFCGRGRTSGSGTANLIVARAPPACP